MTRAQPVIAIDGPAGAGKSTAARRLARRLGFVLVDTGALYRGIALVARERGISWDDGAALGRLAASLTLGFANNPEDGRPELVIDGLNRASEIRTPEISMGASDVSRHPEVRAALLGIQRQLGREGAVVLEGRDIGTVVFPDAEAKIFLTASQETRARRRLLELQERGVASDFDATLEEVRKRDRQDETREVAPLKASSDSIVVDTTGLDLDGVVERLLAIAREAGARGGGSEGD